MKTPKGKSQLSAKDTHSISQKIITKARAAVAESITHLKCSHCAVQFALGASVFKLFVGLDSISEKWKCSNCFRGIHHCRFCGFLGSERVDLIRCSVPSCRQFIHSRCLKEAQVPWTDEVVCPLHFCDVCRQHEACITKLQICSQCTASRHFLCGAPMAQQESTTRAEMSFLEHRGQEITSGLAVCSSHVALLPQTYQLWTCQLAKKHFVQVGDIVLLLKNVQMKAFQKLRKRCKSANYWGIVVQVVALTRGMQAVDVKLFADYSIVSTSNRDVLPVSSIHHYEDHISMLKDCVRWHAFSECTIHFQTGAETIIRVKKVLVASQHTFSALANALSVPDEEMVQATVIGYQSYSQSDKKVRMERSIAPAYAFLDGRLIDTLESAKVDMKDIPSKNVSPPQSSTPSPPRKTFDIQDVDESDLEACVLDFFQNERVNSVSSPSFSSPSMRSVLVRGLYATQPLQNVLLTQEKRAVKVLLQSKTATKCAHNSLNSTPINISQLTTTRKWKRSQCNVPFFSIDLMACVGFKALAATIYNQLGAYLGNHFISSHVQAFYCSTDGIQREIHWNGNRTSNWEIFCANVCHLSLYIL